MSAPLAKPTTQAVHEVAPPPQDSTLVRNVAVILASGALISSMADGLEVLLAPFGLQRTAIIAALGLVNQSRSTASTPRTRLAGHGLSSRDPEAAIPRAAANADLYFRAAYVVQAAKRMSGAMANGETIGVALSNEARHYRQHEAARTERLDSAGRVGKASAIHGPLLGWYLDPDLNNETECILADGNNFYAAEGTVIGYPGSVHRRCGCTPGPPHAHGAMVNDVVRPHIRRVPAKYRLKKVS